MKPAESADIERIWSTFCDQLKAAGRALNRPTTPTDELTLAEGLRYLSRITRMALELALWDSVKDSQRTAELQAYLTQFPDGTFAALARGRMEELKAAALNPVRLPTVAPAPAAPSVVAKTQPEVAAAVPKTSPAAPPAAAATKTAPQLPNAGAFGTLTLTDTRTGIKRDMDVTVQESTAEKTVYSSGDVIGQDGRVLQVRIGEAGIQIPCIASNASRRRDAARSDPPSMSLTGPAGTEAEERAATQAESGRVPN